MVIMITFLLLLYTSVVTSTNQLNVTQAWQTVANHVTQAWQTVANPFKGTTQSLTTCSDKLQNCADYASITCQGEFKQWAIEHCSASCGFCNSIRKSTTQIQQTTTHFQQQTAHTRHPTVQTTGRTIHTTVHTTGQTIHPTVQTTGQTIDPTVQTTGQTIHPTVHTTGQTIHPTVHRTGQTIHPTVHTTSQTIHSTVHTTGQTIHPVLQTKDQTVQTTAHTRHPFVQTTAHTGHPFVHTNGGCRTLDIVFLLDASKAIGNTAFQQELNMTKSVIQQLHHTNFIHIPKYGLVLYGNKTVQYPFKLGHLHMNNLYTIKDSFIGGPGGVDEAISFVRLSAFSFKNGGRPNHANKVLVVMGNGHERHFPNFINLSNDVNIDVYFIGVGPRVAQQRLDQVVTDPTHQIITSPDQLAKILLDKIELCKKQQHALLKQTQ